MKWNLTIVPSKTVFLMPFLNICKYRRKETYLLILKVVFNAEYFSKVIFGLMRIDLFFLLEVSKDLTEAKLYFNMMLSTF